MHLRIDTNAEQKSQKKKSRLISKLSNKIQSCPSCKLYWRQILSLQWIGGDKTSLVRGAQSLFRT